MQPTAIIPQNGHDHYFYNSESAEFLEYLKTLEIVPSVIFADPPFNIGVTYNGAHDDKMDDEDYLEWTTQWLGAADDLMAGHTSLWINVPDKWAAHIVCHCKDVLDMRLNNWCIWHHRFGTWQPKRFIVSKTHALWFSKGDPIIRPERVLVPSDRAAIYNDQRTVDNAGQRMELDVWGFDPYWGRVQGNSKERRRNHPNQLPEKYLERIILACSDPDDTVVDPFAGSGTTACVAAALGRRAITADLSLVNVQSAAERCKSGAVRVVQNG